jgi:ElaB/YqjD/DUF883 family membrane-anchored ribosome-binding protein
MRFNSNKRKNMSTDEANAKLAGDLKEVVDDAEELLRATSGQAGDKVKEVRSRLAAALDRARQSCQSLQDKTAVAASATDQCIREHPYETIGLAFGLGLLVGILIGRR